MKHDIKFNSQRDNLTFNDKFFGWQQCFTTSAFMLMSYYSKNIVATDDKELARYLDDIEVTIGNKGIGEQIQEKNNIKGATSLWWTVQQSGIEKWLKSAGVKGQVIYKDCFYSISDLPNLITNGPVILGTNKLGGLPGGHIILAIGYDDTGIICNDPYGNAGNGYQDKNGASVIYTYDFINKHIIYKEPDKIRCMYFLKSAVA
jgi:uncharacterized protein YvpB